MPDTPGFEVPHTFTPSQPMTEDRLNQNFRYLQEIMTDLYTGLQNVANELESINKRLAQNEKVKREQSGAKTRTSESGKADAGTSQETTARVPGKPGETNG